MGGSTKVIDTTPKQTQGLRTGVIDWLQGGTAGQAAKGSQGGSFFDKLRKSKALQGPNIGPSSGGPQPGAASPFDRIFAAMPGEVGRTEVDRVGDVEGFDRSAVRDVNAPAFNWDPSQIQQINPNMIPSVGGAGGANPNLPDFLRKDVRNVQGYGTQSVDQLGGANSAFFKNMQAQLQPSFTQQRELGLAGAKEAAGNLTGSGFGNYLGSAINRSLGDEQARLADYASQGLQTEVGRQQGDAGRMLQADISNQGADQGFMNLLLNRGVAQGQFDQEGNRLDLQGQMSNQDAQLRGLLANQGASIEGARLGTQIGQGNQETGLRALLANQGADQNFLAQEMQRRFGNQGAGINQNQFQGGMDQQRLIQEFQTRAQQGDANAQRFMQMLLAQSTAGVGQGTVQKSGGIGAVLGPLAGLAGTALGGPIGGAIAKKITG